MPFPLSPLQLLFLALLLRITLLLYASYHDAHHTLKFTDIDYTILVDASRLASPYLRETYRYPPLLAYLVRIGKLSFLISDMATGVLLLQMTTPTMAATWLLNPFVATITARGNAESVLALLVVATLYELRKGRIVTAAIIYAISVHVKIYPIIYALPILLAIRDRKHAPLWHVERRQISFGAIAASTFLGLTAAMYAIYGWPFIEHTLLYHIKRSDHRHNFSPYFLTMYLSHNKIDSFLAFIPQFITVAALGLKFGSTNLYAACLMQTWAFVTWNKVCTSQYFVWYLCLVPLTLSSARTKFSWLYLLCWAGAQGLWLWQAFKLELLGQHTYTEVWLSSLLFFWVNVIGIAKVTKDGFEPITAFDVDKINLKKTARKLR